MNSLVNLFLLRWDHQLLGDLQADFRVPDAHSEHLDTGLCFRNQPPG